MTRARARSSSALSAETGDRPLIETVVTTTGPDGVVNCAAMGVRWGDEELVFWPFDATRTLRNLRARGEAVVHLTDDVLLFVQSALGRPQPAMRPAGTIAGWVIEDVSAWREVVVTEIAPAGDGPARSRVRTGGGPGAPAPSRRSACAGPATRPSRPQSPPPACAGWAPTGYGPSSTASRSWWTRPPARASAQRWTTSGATSPPERDR